MCCAYSQSFKPGLASSVVVSFMDVSVNATCGTSQYTVNAGTRSLVRDILQCAWCSSLWLASNRTLLGIFRHTRHCTEANTCRHTLAHIFCDMVMHPDTRRSMNSPYFKACRQANFEMREFYKIFGEPNNIVVLQACA